MSDRCPLGYLFHFAFHPVRRSSCSMQSFNKKIMSDQSVIVPFKSAEMEYVNKIIQDGSRKQQYKTIFEIH